MPVTWLTALLSDRRWAIAPTGELMMAVAKNYVHHHDMRPNVARDFALWEMEFIRPLPNEVTTPKGDN